LATFKTDQHFIHVFQQGIMQESMTSGAVATLGPAHNTLNDHRLLPYGRMLIDGEWVDAISGETFDDIYPATDAVIARVAKGNADDVDLAVSAARRAYDAGDYRKMNGADRGRLLLRIADLMEANIDQLAELETLDTGKPFFEAVRIDLPQSIACFRYFAGWAGKAMGETFEPNARSNAFTFTLREPIGVCGQIIPWNYPIQMAAWKIAPAICCGNTVVIKPAEQTPVSILRLGELMLDAGLPRGVVNIVTGYGETAGAAIVAHSGVDKVAFTGSVEVGKLILRSAAATMKRVTLELGGKSPNVVFADADLELAAKVALSGVFLNQGEMCTAGSRILVEESAHEQFMAVLSARAAKMVVGDPLDPKTRMGSLVSREHMERVLSYVEKGKNSGAQLVTGGVRIGDTGCFVTPAVFDKVTNEMTIAREEIFGPVASVIPFKDVDDAMRIANETPFGLAAGVWTTDIRKAMAFVRGVKAGTVWVNTYNMTDNALPFGGYKESGIGREQGKAALDAYTQTKSVWIEV